MHGCLNAYYLITITISISISDAGTNQVDRVWVLSFSGLLCGCMSYGMENMFYPKPLLNLNQFVRIHSNGNVLCRVWQ